MRDFQAEVSASHAVVARSILQVQQLAEADTILYANYYELIAGRIRIPIGDEWDLLRKLADISIFPDYFHNIRFSALTLNGDGLRNYGDCDIVFSDEMIAHRSSVFEDNTVLWIAPYKFRDAAHLPKGYRATWNNRACLAAAKLGSAVKDTTTAAEFQTLLLTSGPSSREDRFIEVHTFGPITVRSIASVRIRTVRGKRRPTKAILNALREQLASLGVVLEEVP